MLGRMAPIKLKMAWIFWTVLLAEWFIIAEGKSGIDNLYQRTKQVPTTNFVINAKDFLLQEACAVVGKVFVYPLPVEDIKASYKVSLEDETRCETWVYYDDQEMAIFGLPSPDDVGTTNLTVTIIREGDPDERSASLTIRVVWQSISDIMVNTQTCPGQYTQVAYTFADTNKLRPEEKVRVIIQLAVVFKLDVTDLYFEADHDKEGSEDREQVRLFFILECLDGLGYPSTDNYMFIHNVLYGLKHSLRMHIFFSAGILIPADYQAAQTCLMEWNPWDMDGSDINATSSISQGPTSDVAWPWNPDPSPSASVSVWPQSSASASSTGAVQPTPSSGPPPSSDLVGSLGRDGRMGGGE